MDKSEFHTNIINVIGIQTLNSMFARQIDDYIEIFFSFDTNLIQTTCAIL